MKRPFPFSLMCLALFLLAACAAGPPPTPEYHFAKDAVRLRIKSDPQLNLEARKPHTLLVCIYQMKEKDLFNQLTSNEDGIYQLLDCEPFGDAVTAVKRLIIQPDQDMTLVMDRMEKTKNIGIVAGYYKLDKARMTRVFDIPVAVGTLSSQPEPMNLSINFGAQQITGAEVKPEQAR